MHNKTLLLASSLLSLLVLEAGLQEFGSTPYLPAHRTFVPELGPWRSPNTFVPRPTYSTESHLGHFTNSLGMVDPEPAVDPNPAAGPKIRIALLGDSIIEGLAVPPGFRTSDLLDAHSDDIEVLNFGTSGIGTIQEIAIYQRFVRDQSPEIVVLALFPGNDIANNHLPLEQFLGSNFLATWNHAKLNADSLVLYPPTQTRQKKRANRLRMMLPSTYAHFAALKRKLVRPAEPDTTINTSLAERHLGYLGVYVPPDSSGLWSEAWQITERAVLHLKALAETDGAKFVLVILPDPIHAHPDPASELRASLQMETGPAFDVFYPHRRLSHFASTEGINTIDLFRSFDRYNQVFSLSHPYFGFDSDGHWSRLGHQIAADSLIDSIQKFVCASYSETYDNLDYCVGDQGIVAAD